MSAYYNEFDKKAAAWLRQLIKNGNIADGIVDERSITEVTANDLRGFTQHHFFAGIGGWSYALRLAGWDDSRPVCTASLPCQPFSVAGAGKGKSDERHLLPHFIDLVRQCNFKTIFGEQVPGAIKHGWLDDLYDEMERENYAVGSIVLTAAGIGAPHIRQRLYWVANNVGNGSCNGAKIRNSLSKMFEYGRTCNNTERSSEICGMVYANRQGSQKLARERDKLQGFTQADLVGEMGNTELHGYNADTVRRSIVDSEDESWIQQFERPSTEWINTDWLYCRDNKYRPIKPGVKPLDNGVSRGMGYSSDPSEPINANATQEARVMRLKGYGNAIVPQVAAQFIKVFMGAW